MLPFEEIWLDEGGERRPLTRQEFLALPMAQRIRHILQETVEFVHRGQRVSTRDALLALHAVECAEHAATADRRS